ncbi:MAG: DUF11 domain-containing protein [Actinomycetota bacterium]|nr:DUF11 domain-containing protein [Actinomycetota bacterium]
MHNAGPSSASNVVLTYPLPAGVAYQSANSSQGSCSQSSGALTCALGDLAANATATVTIRVTATTPGPVTNTVTITATETDPQTANNSASWNGTINPAPAPAPEPEPEPEPTEDPTPTARTGTDNKTPQRHGVPWTPDLRLSNETPEADPQPAAEPETPESKPISEYVGAFDHLDQVMLMAMGAEQDAGATSFDPSLGLLLSLIWLGPTLVVLARSRLRHRAE